ncbi:hypothetical protein DMH03_16545 [Amycolatopsis sp. WAC 01376]|uniref:hypothetical protein n=1 Tax=Amycolatopsis sp. WAC 01376 TaxID=2203195 RepID=UPI000F7B216B|nr:hypothetical protein [Amycolatopsis sp. WAC 01376]RSM63575.1 hypothetical protein DMH03_16545 [Amycolatopsis sp. WAC 01376]
MTDVGTKVRAWFTAILLTIMTGWLVVVGFTLDIPITKAADGSVLDVFERSKDVLLVVTPLLTTALGYWFGSAGRHEAQDAASAARTEAAVARQQLAGVLDSSSEPGLLGLARQANPQAFAVTTPVEQAAPTTAPDTGDQPPVSPPSPGSKTT